MTRAGLPHELANPGVVTRADYIEPTSGNKVVTASGIVEPPENEFADDALLLEPTRKQSINKQNPTKQDSARSDFRQVRRRPQHVARRQAEVFSDADLGDDLLSTPNEFDANAFGDVESGDPSTDGADLGFDDSPPADNSGFDVDDLGDEPVIDDDAGFDALDLTDERIPEPAQPGAFDDNFQDDSSNGQPNLEAPSGKDITEEGVDKLPPPGADEGVTDESDGKPTDLSTYNKRNCPEEIAIFEAAWTAFQNRPLSAISLDITPEFEPNEGTAEMAKQRDETLKGAPGREWRDQSGRLVASGLLKDFKDGRVVIETASGELKAVEFYGLSSSDICFVTAWWGVPSEYRPTLGTYQVRDWTTQTFTWKASGLCHKPLYFEEVQLERYGHSAGPVKQTMLSGAHFFGNILFLPYKMGLNPPNECQYALGYYRPGDCAPWLLHAVPLSARGAFWQAGAMLGGIGLVP